MISNVSDSEHEGAFRQIIHKIVAYPVVYDLVQRTAGATVIYRRLRRVFGALPPNTLFLDIGGGTGLITRHALPQLRYVCLDVDPEKLGGFVDRHSAGVPLLADGGQLPIRSESMDWSMIMAVAHHLTDDQLHFTIQESLRVLKENGALLLLDPVWAPRRWPGRLLWAYDRGSHPRTIAQLVTVLSEYGEVVSQEDFAVYHRYLMCIVRPKAGTRSSTAPQ